MEKLSKHLTREKAEYTATGLPNRIPDELLPNIIWIGENIVDKIMDYFNLAVLDWIEIIYRSLKVNKKAGSTSSSWHLIAAAVDAKLSNLKNHLTNSQLFYFVVNNCKFDRIIWEKGDKNNPQWVHIQGKPGPLRQEIGIHWVVNGEAKYKYFKTIQKFEQFKNQLYKK